MNIRVLENNEVAAAGSGCQLSRPEHSGVPADQNALSQIPDPQPSASVSRTSANPPPAFSRFPGETPRAFGAFITWFQLGHGRSHQAVADKLGEGLPTIKNWASKYDWSDRLLACASNALQQAALDAAARQRQQTADWADRLNRFREQEWDAAQKLLSAAQCFLDSFGEEHVSKMSLSQVSRALTISSNIARSAITSAELPPSSEPALAPIQQQMLDALKRLSAAPPQSASTSPPTHQSIDPLIHQSNSAPPASGIDQHQSP